MYAPQQTGVLHEAQEKAVRWPGEVSCPNEGSVSVTTEFNQDKERIAMQVQCTFDFMPDNLDEAEKLRPWLAYQLDGFLRTLTYADLEMPELMGAVAVLGPAFSRILGTTHATKPLPTLRVVGD